MAAAASIRVQDEQGNIHVFPGEATLEMIALAMNVRPPTALTVSDPRTVPNARIRNLPNPAEGETSAAGALYHGAKAGVTLGMLPAAAAAVPTTIPAAIGAGTGIVGATVAGTGAKAAAESLGAGELGQEAAGDAGSVVGGILGAGLGEAGANIGRRIYDALPKELQKEVVGLVGGRYVHAANLVRAAGKMLAETPPTPKAPEVTGSLAEFASPKPAPPNTPSPQAMLYLGRLQEIARQIEAEEATSAKPKNVTPSRAAALKKPVTPSATSDDLTNLLQESLKRAQAAKGKTLGDLQ